MQITRRNFPIRLLSPHLPATTSHGSLRMSLVSSGGHSARSWLTLQAIWACQVDSFNNQIDSDSFYVSTVST